MTPEEKRIYWKAYREANREKRVEYSKNYYKNNKETFKIKRKQWLENNKEKTKLDNKNRLLKNKITVIKYYSSGSGSCACCGENGLPFLTIDHINNNGAEHRRKLKGNAKTFSGSSLYNWLIQNSFPEGFQVLCFNCNCAKSGNKGICPHNTN